MPRGARLDAPGTLHHVIIRGIEKGNIVRDDDDRKEFLRRMGELAHGMGTSIYAFALMTNHAHILLKSGEQGLSTFMRRLLSGYAQYFNRRHQRVGHLFQNRYKSIICEEDAYFDKLVAYIHLNPLRAGLVNSFQELESYPWCGHAPVMKKAHYTWLDRDYVLQFFGERDGEARRAYLAYLEEEIGENREKELSGGGLLRSHGGWSKVQSMRMQGIKALSDDRILGGDSFVREVLQEAEDQVSLLLSTRDRSKQISRDIEEACAKEGITAAALRSGSRKGKFSVIRKELAKKLVDEYGLSLAEIARQLGVTTSAVSYMVR
ncbi:MAG: transposase [Chlorobium sp.]|nr:transposase [Chlorobium sp.]